MPGTRLEVRKAATWCALLGLLAAASGFSALPAFGGATIDTVRVSLTPFRSSAVIFMAERAKYFDAERIKLDWIPFAFGQQFIPVLIGGQLDVGAGGVSAGFFNAISAGQKIRVVAGIAYGATPGSLGSLVVRKDLSGTVRSVADLKGRKVAFNGIGTYSHYFVAKILASGGLSVDNITMVAMPFPAMIAALQRGAVDVAFMNPPSDTETVAMGAGFILAEGFTVLPGEPSNFLFFGPTLLEQNRGLGKRFMTAFLRGAQRHAEGPTPSNVAAVADYLKISPDTVRNASWTTVYKDGFVDGARLRRYQDWLFEIGLVNVRNPIATVMDTAFVEEARTVLGLGGR